MNHATFIVEFPVLIRDADRGLLSRQTDSFAGNDGVVQGGIQHQIVSLQVDKTTGSERPKLTSEVGDLDRRKNNVTTISSFVIGNVKDVSMKVALDHKIAVNR